eukprot:COSAG05_NODE_1930_length_3818_cov_2.245227_1_plen_116_part_00
MRTAVPEVRSHFTTSAVICDQTPLPCEPVESAPVEGEGGDLPTAAFSNFIEDPLFFIGAAGSGVGFHRHGHAWNAVVYGRKRWFLYPPSFVGHQTVSLSHTELDGVGWARTCQLQ